MTREEFRKAIKDEFISLEDAAIMGCKDLAGTIRGARGRLLAIVDTQDTQVQEPIACPHCGTVITSVKMVHMFNDTAKQKQQRAAHLGK